jgi:hypothetical protein
VLKKMGAHGVYSGNPEAVGDFMASLPLGVLRNIKGQAETSQPGKLWQGTKDILGGTAQAATMPGSFVAPEAGEVAASGADKAMQSLTPSAMRDAAGVLFQEVKTKAGNFPVDVEAPGQVALRMKTLYERGAGYTPPSVITRFLNRVTKPGGAPMTYEEARDFYSNATRLSADEALKLTPKAKMTLTQFTHTLGQSIQSAANNAGVGAEHAQAMQDYASAMRYADRLENLKEVATKIGTKAALGAAGGAGATAVYEGYKALKDQ